MHYLNKIGWGTPAPPITHLTTDPIVLIFFAFFNRLAFVGSYHQLSVPLKRPFGLDWASHLSGVAIYLLLIKRPETGSDPQCLLVDIQIMQFHDPSLSGRGY